MVDSRDIFVEVPCELTLEREGDPATGEIILTEGGDLTIQFEEGAVSPHTDLEKSWKTITGRDDRGYDVTAEYAVLSQAKNFSLTKLSPTAVTISQNEDCALGEDEEAVVEFDMLCFLPQIPPRNQIDSSSLDTLENLSEEEEDRPALDIPEEIVVQYLETEKYEAYGVPLTDTTDRRDSIKSGGQPIRTASIRIKQDIHGDLSHQVERAENIVLKILEISQLVQEVTPRHVRSRIVSINGSSIEDMPAHYEILESGGSANVGARFSQYPDKVLWGDFHEYVAQAYENYTSRVREELRLRQVLGYYVDARDPNRPVEGKMLSVCSAIELLALWHAREDEVSEKTALKIEHLIDKLNVETKDLAKEVVPDVSELETPEYFWQRQRNYVVHGDPDVPTKEVIDSYGATLVLLKRVLRNQLLGAENPMFEDFYSMSPRPSIEFED